MSDGPRTIARGELGRRALTVAWLTIVWVALWEAITWANLLGGVAVGALVSFLIPPLTPGPHLDFRPLAAVKLVGYFIVKLVEASAIMAWEVLTPTNRDRPGIVNVPLTTNSPTIATFVANMVSLTPGTLTLEADEETMTLKVHVLHLHTLEEARAAVLTFERLALLAFPERAPGAQSGVDR